MMRAVMMMIDNDVSEVGGAGDEYDILTPYYVVGVAWSIGQGNINGHNIFFRRPLWGSERGGRQEELGSDFDEGRLKRRRNFNKGPE